MARQLPVAGVFDQDIIHIHEPAIDATTVVQVDISDAAVGLPIFSNVAIERGFFNEKLGLRGELSSTFNMEQVAVAALKLAAVMDVDPPAVHGRSGVR